MKKERPLTQRQMTCLRMAEETLFGDTKLVEGFTFAAGSLRKRGLVQGAAPHCYLTDAGKAKREAIVLA